MHSQLSGFLVIDKPQGISSAKLVAIVKKSLGVAKIGHTGTLDPFATGVMICCINQATRLAGFFLYGSKTYEAVLYLGVETDTQDLTGEIIATHKITLLSKNYIQEIFQKFKGQILQKPPVFSALKHKGTPLYKLARRGQPVEKPARTVKISQIDIMDINLPEIRFQVTCSAGTYIRTLGADIGKALGCGGHLIKLKRVKSGYFSLKQALSLQDLQDMPRDNVFNKHLIKMTEALPQLATYNASEKEVENIKFGRKIESFLNISPPVGIENFIKIVDDQNDLIAILEYKKEVDQYNYCCVLAK